MKTSLVGIGMIQQFAPWNQPGSLKYNIDAFVKVLDKAEDVVNDLVIPCLNQNQFDALTSLCIDIGRKPFIESSLLLSINEHQPTQRIIHGFLLLLDNPNDKTCIQYKRREAEIVLYLTPSYDKCSDNY